MSHVGGGGEGGGLLYTWWGRSDVSFLVKNLHPQHFFGWRDLSPIFCVSFFFWCKFWLQYGASLDLPPPPPPHIMHTVSTPPGIYVNYCRYNNYKFFLCKLIPYLIFQFWFFTIACTVCATVFTGKLEIRTNSIKKHLVWLKWPLTQTEVDCQPKSD